MILLAELFVSFFKVGAFAFGGGLAMLPLIFQEVARYGMMSDTEFARLVALSQMTPGPVAVNAATYTGMIYAGIPGALTATFAVALPSFAIMLLVMKFVEAFRNSRGLQGVLGGIRPATVGLITAAFVYMAQMSVVDGRIFSMSFIEGFPGNINIFPLCVFIFAAVASGRFKMSPVIVILLSGAAGALICGTAA